MGTKIIASAQNWIEASAVEQLERTAKLKGMQAAVGLPDLHPGKDAPIGAVFATCNIIYPHLVGNDIGCGMSLWQTEVASNKLKIDRWIENLKGLEGAWEGDASQFLHDEGVEPSPYDESLGTIGGGNHFVELQCLHKVCDQSTLSTAGIDAQSIFLLVHSGSRGLGEFILRSHQAKHGPGGLECGTADAIAYLGAHNHAVAWAQANRKLIALRFLAALGTKANRILDICHNSVQLGNVEAVPCWLHRKGAAPSDQGVLVIPGSRGSLSYIVAATGDQSANLATIAHGAGRKWKRSDCRGRLEKRFTKESLLRTEIGSRVICDDKELLYEEAPQAYKNVDVVVEDLVDAGLVRILAVLAPLITYKTKLMRGRK